MKQAIRGWSPADAAQAQVEGWNLALDARDGLRIQRTMGGTKLFCDSLAWEKVLYGAEAHHITARRLLTQQNPALWADIEAHGRTVTEQAHVLGNTNAQEMREHEAWLTHRRQQLDSVKAYNAHLAQSGKLAEMASDLGVREEQIAWADPGTSVDGSHPIFQDEAHGIEFAKALRSAEFSDEAIAAFPTLSSYRGERLAISVRGMVMNRRRGNQAPVGEVLFEVRSLRGTVTAAHGDFVASALRDLSFDEAPVPSEYIFDVPGPDGVPIKRTLDQLAAEIVAGQREALGGAVIRMGQMAIRRPDWTRDDVKFALSLLSAVDIRAALAAERPSVVETVDVPGDWVSLIPVAAFATTQYPRARLAGEIRIGAKPMRVTAIQVREAREGLCPVTSELQPELDAMTRLVGGIPQVTTIYGDSYVVVAHPNVR